MNIKVRKWKFIQKVQNIHVFILLSIDFDVLLFLLQSKKKGFLQTIFFILPAVIFSYSHMSALFCLSVSYYFYVYIHIYFFVKICLFFTFPNKQCVCSSRTNITNVYLLIVHSDRFFVLHIFFAVVIIHDERQIFVFSFIVEHTQKTCNKEHF